MIRHILKMHTGSDPKPDISDYQVMHIIYRVDTVDVDSESNTVLGYATTGYQVLELDNWDINNHIPGANVNNEILEQWLSEKVDLDTLKNNNIQNLKPLPK